MTPRALLQHFKKEGKPAAGYLFLGAEPFFRDRCRAAIKKALLGEPADPEGLVEVDLKEQPLTRIVDEARTLSLFATSRLLVVKNAENVLPRGGVRSKDDPSQTLLKSYFADPTPGTVVVIEATRFDGRDRDEQAKLDRIAKFFSAVPETVELKPISMSDAVKAATVLAGRLNLSIERSLLVDLVEMLAADVAKIENNLEKLALYATSASAGTTAQAAITAREIELLVPEARHSGVYEFSDALAHRDRTRALGVLDTMAKAGTYWPMQLNLIAGLFRQALAANELRLRSAGAIGSKLGSYGLRLWPARSNQVAEIATQFSRAELERALIWLFEADRELRSPNPDDRIIMEHLTVRLTS